MNSARVDPWLKLRFNLAMNQKIALVLILLFGAGLNSFAQTNSTPGAPTAGIVAATKKFLATLDDAQRGKVVFDFKDEAQRKRWSNLPTAIFKRQGLRMGDLTKPQREAAGGAGSGVESAGVREDSADRRRRRGFEAIERPDDFRAR